MWYVDTNNSIEVQPQFPLSRSHSPFVPGIQAEEGDTDSCLYTGYQGSLNGKSYLHARMERR